MPRFGDLPTTAAPGLRGVFSAWPAVWAALLSGVALHAAAAAREEPPPAVVPRTGWKPDTPEEAAWMRKHFPVIQGIKLNRIALERINAARRARGLPPAPDDQVELAPLGQEMVFQGAPAAEKSSEAQRALVIENGPMTVDNSAGDEFPPIGNQGSIGSCISFACTYYQLTYETALVRGWKPKLGDTNMRFSPKWTYNMCNDGEDGGSGFGSTYSVLLGHGAATWAEFPYNSNYRQWCLDGEVWRHALEFRPLAQGTITYSDPASFMADLKAELVNAHVVTYGTKWSSWVPTTINDDPGTTQDDAYVGQKAVGYMKNDHQGGHGMTIVGYNDYLWCDLNGNSVVEAAEKGAFKVANSHGLGSGNSGFWWVPYDAVRKTSEVPSTPSWPPGDRSNWGIFCDNGYVLTARLIYTPKLVAYLKATHPKRSDVVMHPGIGDVGETSASWWYVTAALSWDGGEYAFDGSTGLCSGTFCLDLTDVSPVMGVTKRYFVGMEDSPATGGTGQIQAMWVRDVWAGNLLVGLIHPGDDPSNFNPASGASNGSRAWCWLDHTFNSASPPPTVTISATDVTASEWGLAAGSFVLSRRDSITGSPVTTGDLPVNLACLGAAQNSTDYQTIAPNVTIPHGSASLTITVTPIQDTEVEGDETVTISVVPGNGYLRSGSATLTISDDDSRITIEATDATASEPGADTGTFRLTRSGGTDGALTVFYTVSGTATPGTDYQTLSGFKTFGSGVKEADVTVIPYDDVQPELDETVTLTLTPNPAYAVGSPSSATVTILRDDNLTPVVTITSPTAPRGYLTYVPCNVLLEATVTDDGNPPPANVACSWQRISGPNTLSFGPTQKTGSSSPYSVTSSVRFTEHGSYLLRLTADDGWVKGFADVILVVLPPGTPVPGLNATYCNSEDFSGTGIEHLVAQVKFNWGKGSPDPVIQKDHFSSRWVGLITPPYSETYTFYTYTDDGARLWVRNQLLVDEWHGQPATEWSGQVFLVAGVAYDLTMESYDKASSAVAELRWSSPSLPKSVVPASALSTGFTPPNCGAFVEAGPDQATTTIIPVFLDATVTDEGGAVPWPTLQWTKLSGPGTVTFGTPTAEDTTASFDMPGAYILRLTADDTVLKTFDELTVDVEGVNAPDVAGVDPDIGYTSGNTSVTISGTNFSTAGTVTVEFSGEAAGAVTVLDPRTIICRTPAHAAGLVAVKVTNPDGFSDTLADAYLYWAPEVTGVSPAAGRMGGGTNVTIAGTGFTEGVSVKFGTASATNVVLIYGAAPLITCDTPAHVAGAVDVEVIYPDGPSATLEEGYTYTGWEGDCAPRDTLGDEDVLATDLVQMRRFAAGLDTVASGPEFQRADIAPRDTLGDASLFAADLTQLRRYAAGLDRLAEAGGPSQPTEP